jgi:hypothetical protein
MNIRTSSLLAVSIVMLTAVSCSLRIPVSDDTVQIYAFTGTVVNIGPVTSSAAKTGDRVTGTFMIDHKAVRTDIKENHGSYRFASGFPLVFSLNTMKFDANTSYLPCMASVYNNELSEDKPLDSFKMTCTDKALSSSLGLAFLASTLNLSDSSAAVFSGTSLPRDVHLQTFDNASLALIGTRQCKNSDQCKEVVFDILIRIDSIVKR